MKYATNRSQSIAYDVFGRGPAVVLQHGLLSSRKSWKERGYVDALAGEFTVIVVDSLGHGDSDKPADAACYRREARAHDIAAVLDAEKIDRAHFVGYSLGAWLGIGVLAHRPDRLSSITISGFDPAGTEALMPGLSIDQLLELMRPVVPDLVDGVTSEAKPGLARCLEALRIREIPVAVLIDCGLPVNLWTGIDDTCCTSLKDLHGKMPNSTLSEVPGDHFGAIAISRKSSADAIHRFLTSLT